MLAFKEVQKRAVQSCKVTYSEPHDEKHQNFKLDSEKDAEASAWVAKRKDQNQWIQLEAEEPRHWIAVITQGRGTHEYEQWVTSFYVAFSLDGEIWEYVDEGRLFVGNTDGFTKIQSKFRTGVNGKFLKILPQGFCN